LDGTISTKVRFWTGLSQQRLDFGRDHLKKG
jgi:hypothetical protein